MEAKMVTEKERLDNCQKQLEERGYSDVKFFFGAICKPMSAVAAEAASILEAVLEKRTKNFKPFGDSTRV